MSSNELKTMLQKSSDDLFLELGEILNGATVTSDGSIQRTSAAIAPQSDDDAVQHGRRIFQSLKGRIHHDLCQKWNACAKIKNYEADRDDAQLAAAIADVLAVTFTGIPVMVLSALVVKQGVKSFCTCDKKPRTFFARLIEGIRGRK